MEFIVERLNELLQGHPLLAVPFAFLGGVLTSFTPCVYPMIPIVVGVIGARSSRSRLQAFLLSLSYVLGLSIVYAALGLISALTGSLFGRISTNPLLNFIVANLFLLFALSMFGVFEIRLPAFGGTKNAQQTGLFSAFIVGIGSGFVAAPCTAPVLGSLLVYVSTTRNAVLGVILMFAFSLGMSTLLILIGTFTGIVTALPKSGKWMNAVKYTLGFVMIAVAEYFLYKAGQFAAF